MRHPATIHSLTPTLESAVMMRAPLVNLLPAKQLDYSAVEAQSPIGAPRLSKLRYKTLEFTGLNYTEVRHTQHRSTGARVEAQRIYLYVTIDTRWVTALRHLVVNSFSERVLSIGIQPLDHAKKMKVCLCFNRFNNVDNKIYPSMEERLMTAIMRALPSAEFGRISAV